MNQAIKGAYYCNQYRTTELSERIYKRNQSTIPMQMNFDPRSASTRRIVMPIIDCNRPSFEKIERRPVFNTELNCSSNADSLPFNGYQHNIDVESKLKNINFALQAAPQSKFIPNSKSDLYDTSYLTPPIEKSRMTNQLLFRQETFNTFNPNTCNIGNKTFNNNTRVQIKNYKPVITQKTKKK